MHGLPLSLSIHFCLSACLPVCLQSVRQSVFLIVLHRGKVAALVRFPSTDEATTAKEAIQLTDSVPNGLSEAVNVTFAYQKSQQQWKAQC